MAFPLHTEIPKEGMALVDLFKGSNYDIAAAQQRLMEVAREEGLPFTTGRGMTYHSKTAQMLGLWAETKGGGEAFHMAAFRAVFVDHKNIAEQDVLLELAEAAGLDRTEAEEVLKTESFMNKVDADWEFSKKLGVSAVPTFIYGGRSIVGAQPYEALKKLIEEAGKGPSPFKIMSSG